METDLQGLKNKEFLLTCINSAINNINAGRKVKGATLQLYEGLERIPGNAEVAKQMFCQIDECNIFIGDITVVQRISDVFKELVNKKDIFFRYTPNCNVYGEYNRALGKNDLFWQQVILLMNEVNGDPHKDAQSIPFDTRERRYPMTFSITDYSEEGQTAARKSLVPKLEEAIAKSAKAALENLGEQFKPFESWYEQHKDGRYNFTEVESTFIQKYRQTILTEKDPILVTAPESKQNTILIHRIFEGQDETFVYLYSSCKDSSRDDIKVTAGKIFKKKDENQGVALVIDYCDAVLFNDIINLRKKYKAPNKVVAILKKDIDISQFNIEYPYKRIDLSESVFSSNKTALDNAGISNSFQQDTIGLFCNQDPLLVQRLASSITPEEREFIFDDSQLTTKLIGAQPDSNERIILRALSVFDYIGWKDEKKQELEYILSNSCITGTDVSPDILIKGADEVINKHIRQGYITQRGRTVSLTSEPLIRQLSNEWLEEITAERYFDVLKVLSSPDSGRLSKEFHDRFVKLDRNELAKDIIDKLFAEGGGLYESELFDTEKGSLFIEAFAEIMPELVSKQIAQYVLPKPIEELQNFENGRRNIVWTLRRLCFIPELFAQSAECMMKLALAENESWSNNATGEFKSLFPLYLPATAASLDIRLQCLKTWAENPLYKPMVMEALSRATHTGDYLYFGGAETCGSVKRESYQPKTQDEINTYIKDCLDLLLSEIKQNTAYVSRCLKSLEDNVGVLCKAGYAHLVLPVIIEIADLLKGDWEKMFNNLSLFKGRLYSNLIPESQALYDEAIRLLKKEDFVSRFARVEKEVFYGRSSNFEERYEQQKTKYTDLANEMYDDGLVREDIITGLLTVECIGSSPFGNTLAKKMSDAEKRSFVELCIKIINSNAEAKPGILTDFVGELTDDLFNELTPLLATSRISYVLFTCFGRKSILPNDPRFDLLGKQVKDGIAKVEDYHQYWCNIRTDLLTDDVVYQIFKEVLSHEGGVEPVMRMSGFLGFNDKIGEYSKTAYLLSSTIVEVASSSLSIVRNNQILHVTGMLLKDFDLSELALVLNQKVIELASDAAAYFSHSYEVEELYRLMMIKYFDTIWPSLSAALASDNEHYLTYYNLKSFLGSSMIDERTPIIMEGNHFAEMLEWCAQYPDVAPARLAGMIVIAKEEQFSDEAKQLIDLYADRPYVLNEIGCNLDSFSSCGSVVPYYERRMKIYNTMLEHENPTVRDWAQKQSDACKYLMQRESTAEEEKW